MSYSSQPEVRIEAPEGFQIDMENQQWINKSFDIALLIIAKCQELGLSKADLIDKTGLLTNRVIEILSGKADLTLSEITKLEEVLNTQLIEIYKK